MAEIKFDKDYGYPPASPFHIVWHQDSYSDEGVPSFTKHVLREDAENEAAQLAIANPGRTFHVLAAMATISTSTDVIGKRFDPTRSVIVEAPPAKNAEEFQADEVEII